VTRRRGHLLAIRNFPARCNTEQSMKTVTHVPGLKCYQRARLQSVEPQVALLSFRLDYLCSLSAAT
jgi:hypothetical protein